MALTATEQQAIDLLWYDYEIDNWLDRYFYRFLSLKVDEEVQAFLRTEFDNGGWIPSERYHLVECRTTGFTFEFCLHIVAEIMELRAPDASWRFCFYVRNEVEDGNNGVMRRQSRIDGDLSGLVAYASVLKLACPDPEDFAGFLLTLA